MQEITFNKENLSSKDIEEIVTRTKALLINSNNEIILGYCDNTYQFPGGHLEKGETLKDCLLREVKEETGIILKNQNLEPFFLVKHYTKNYRNTNKNRLNNIYYYLIKTDQKIDLTNTNYDKFEKEKGYTLKIISLENVKNILLNSINDNEINGIIVKEMLLVLDEYKKVVEKHENRN